MTSYFNPLRYRRRRENYRWFRQRLGVPLVAVELAFDSEFELGDEDADILIQLRGGAVLWQKERLLNLALQALPSDCAKVAWVDCDVIFADDDWAERAERLLDTVPLAHLFSHMHYMPRDLPVSELGIEAGEVHRTSIAFAALSGLDPAACLEQANQGAFGQFSPGFAWAARRDLLDVHGFYDACIVGAGDRAMISAKFGCFDHVIRRHRMSDQEVSYYLDWARPFHGDVLNATGCVEGHLFHLWHGTLENRRMRERHEGLHQFKFDPYMDIAVADNGAWRWNSEKPAMHDFVHDHFARRQEDGEVL